MPELPEVETIRRGLEEKLSGAKIKEVIINLSKPIKMPSPAEFKKRLTGRKIRGVRRRGKYIILEIEGGDYLFIHLKLTGQLIVEKSGQPIEKHTHIIFRFTPLENSSLTGFTSGKDLRFIDLRRFGTMNLVNKLEELKAYQELGAEPLDPFFTVEKLKWIIDKRRTKIKQLLMDQQCIAGIGNIYAAEILFRAGISPLRAAAALKDDEIKKLLEEIKRVLNEAIKYKGSSVDNYVTTDGEEGDYGEKLLIYGRDKKICPVCKTKLKSIKLGGRGTNYCPKCQK